MSVTSEERALLAEAFDAAFYLSRNPDVKELGIDPLQHFIDDGWREDRDPSAAFSIASYLDLNADIAKAGINPLLHYLQHGRAEGRPVRIELGFRYEILKHAPTLEAKVETGRPHDLPPLDPAPLARLLAALGPRLFITLSQDDFSMRLGGVQLCIEREAAALAQEGWSHLHLYPAVPSPVTDFETMDPVVGLLIDGRDHGLFRAADIAAALRRRAPFGAVSFAAHSLLGHSVDAAIEVLRAAGTRSGFLWLHDQTSLCASFNLLRNDVEFCGAPPIDSAACSICIYGLRRRVQIADHRALFEAFAVTAVAPSQAQLDLWLSTSDYPYAAAVVHPHAARIPTGPAPAAEGPLRVAFLGFPTLQKGWPVFAGLVERFGADPRYQFMHLGQQDENPSPIPFVHVEQTPGEENAMVAAVRGARIDVALILSLVPETFCLAAHEAAAGGAAVVALPDSNALARFASDPANGRLAADEEDLAWMFESGDILSLSRAARGAELYELRYSRLSADFLPKDAAS